MLLPNVILALREEGVVENKKRWSSLVTAFLYWSLSDARISLSICIISLPYRVIVIYRLLMRTHLLPREFVRLYRLSLVSWEPHTNLKDREFPGNVQRLFAVCNQEFGIGNLDSNRETTAVIIVVIFRSFKNRINTWLNTLCKNRDTTKRQNLL